MRLDAQHPDITLVGLVNPGKHPHNGTFPTSTWPQKAENLARLDFETYFLNGRDGFIKLFAYFLDCNNRFQGWGYFLRSRFGQVLFVRGDDLHGAANYFFYFFFFPEDY
jgi:hypothetical protein